MRSPVIRESILCMLAAATICLCGCRSAANTEENTVVSIPVPVQVAEEHTPPPSPAPTNRISLPVQPSGAPSSPAPTATPEPAYTPEPTQETEPTPAPTPDPEPAEEPQQQAPYSPNSLFDMTNQQRQAHGLSLFRPNSTLNDAAAIRARELATLYSHTRPDGSSCFTVSSEAYAENIAYGMNVTKAVIMDMWMDSDGHRANILSAKYTSLGVGEYSVDGNDYYVQLFGY